MIFSLNVVILQVPRRQAAFEFHTVLESPIKFLPSKIILKLGTLFLCFVFLINYKSAFILKLMLSSDFALAHDQLNKEVIFCLTCK